MFESNDNKNWRNEPTEKGRTTKKRIDLTESKTTFADGYARTDGGGGGVGSAGRRNQSLSNALELVSISRLRRHTCLDALSSDAGVLPLNRSRCGMK